MVDNTSQDQHTKTAGPPAPEVLRPQSDSPQATESAASATTSKLSAVRRRVTYRPSHKATFIGLGVVIGVLALNAGIIMLVIKSQASTDSAALSQGKITLSTAALDKLGVSRNPVGNSGEELIIGPNSKFNGTVTVGSNVSIAGQLTLNSKFSATDATLTNLQAGTTSLSQLNVNGDGTVTNLNLRQDLAVVGTSRLQGPVVLSQLLTVNNSANIVGNLSVGGSLSVRGFEVSSLTVSGHTITKGSAPSVGRGSAVGSNGTVSISGNDIAGTVAVNTGTGAGNGIVAQIAFRTAYTSTPHVVITAVGAGVDSVYISRTAGGFSIGVNGALAPGGYAFDYIVMQ